MKNIMKNIISILLITLMTAGCYQTRVYMKEEPRVDQQMPSDRGFAGEPKPAAFGSRKGVVVELTQKPRVEEMKILTQEEIKSADVGLPDALKPRLEAPSHSQAQPSLSGDAQTTAAASDVSAQTPVTYTVEKDDTLQKISKKFYGAFGLWTRIYDVNRDLIEDPNFLKPGTVIVIPQE